jgi:hypothetical protein
MKWEIFAPSRKSVLIALALLPLAACSDGSGSSEDARVQVKVTDAPSDYLASAEVWVSRVYLQGGPGHQADTTDTSGGTKDLFNDKDHPFHVDLLTLRSGIVANLTQPVTVDVGGYKMLRIVVDSAKVTLKQGFTFEGGGQTMSLKIPSGSSSGVKVFLNSDITLAAGDSTTVLVDFDVDQNFVVQGSLNSATGVKGILFTPVIKEKTRTQVAAG